MANFTGVKGPEPHLLVPDTADFLHEVDSLEVGEGQGTASSGYVPAEQVPDSRVIRH